MARLSLMMACCVGLCGCQLVQVCPPLRGTVVDAVTGAPVGSARVTIRYSASGWVHRKIKPERETRTDERGRYEFAARSDWFVFLPAPADPVCGFRLQAEAAGYHASDAMEYGPWVGLEPPPGIEEGFPPGTPKVVYRGGTVIVDPIALAPAGAAE